MYLLNVYTIQRGHSMNIKRYVVLNFISINCFDLLSQTSKLATSSDLNVSCISNTMSRSRFNNILVNIHVQGNILILNNNKNKLFRLKPLINYYNEVFATSHHGTKDFSIN